MINKRFILTFLFSIGVFFSTVFAQKAVKFDKLSHDFGKVPEDGGNVSYKFEFTNTSKQAIRIVQVDAECGCTTPQWSEDMIKPGEKGFVHAEYEPYNRPGSFDKNLTVRATSDTILLNIKGYVDPRERSDAEQDLPETIGSLLVKSNNLQLGNLTNEKTISKDFKVFNNGEKAILFDKVNTKLPAHLKVSLEPAELAPKSYGRIVVYFDPVVLNDYGYITDYITLMTNDEDTPEKELIIRSSVQEYFPKMTADELAKAPKLLVDQTEHDFGSVKGDLQLTHDFVLKNTGKKELIIRKIKPACTCTLIESPKSTLKPGEEIKVKVTFDTKGRRGTQSKSIIVYTNSPSNPVETLRVKAVVSN